jgi:hypothetical protein
MVTIIIGKVPMKVRTLGKGVATEKVKNESVREWKHASKDSW